MESGEGINNFAVKSIIAMNNNLFLRGINKG
jgi:hypothetical protein